MNVEEQPWSSDPRNAVYANMKGKVFRAFPINVNEVNLYDVISGAVLTCSNGIIEMYIRDGVLVEIDPFKQMVTLPANNPTLKPAEAGVNLTGKYAKKQPVAG